MDAAPPEKAEQEATARPDDVVEKAQAGETKVITLKTVAKQDPLPARDQEPPGATSERASLAVGLDDAYGKRKSVEFKVERGELPRQGSEIETYYGSMGKERQGPEGSAEARLD